MGSLFLEDQLTSELLLRAGAREERSERRAGLGREDAPGRYTWAPLGAGEPLQGLAGPARERGRALTAAPFPREDWQAAVALCEALAAPGLQLHLREVQRRTLCGAEGAPVEERRRTLTLELKAVVGDGPARQSAQLERSFQSAASLAAAQGELAAAGAALRDAAASKREPCPSGERTVVLPPGSDAGVLFHELCGHPMEGDVVARNASYLARARGRQVAQPFVNVTDGPAPDEGGVGGAVDDEGTPCGRAALISAGVVGTPMTDLRCAKALGLAPTGHGRRVDFRHPALPRMSHTAVAPHQGALAQLLDGVEDGLLVSFLTPRHVHLASGDFSFFVVEARRILRGRLGPFVGPALLKGDGLTALGRIDAVGADAASFHGLKGCGKLDQPGLPVSFGLPAVRFTSLAVEPWER